MKIFKMTILMVLIILFTMFFTTSISKATTVEVTTDNLNFRREASTDSEVIMAFQTGYKCELIAEEGNWYKVKYLGMIVIARVCKIYPCYIFIIYLLFIYSV